MGRKRLPGAKKSPYITAEGYAALQADLAQQWHKRKHVTAALSAAAAEGDRSENAEYIYRKKELAGIDRRIRYLQKRMPELHVIDTRPGNVQKIFFGAWVTLEDTAAQTLRYRIVGPDEFDLDKGWISVDSPVARALLGKTINDEVRVQTPEGEHEYSVLNVDYKEHNAQ
ncbi:MAG: transcription elongation factor GreB [Gammaproteobacteria bacterium]|nr:MAG: transcription elongation factor GreB [Gammaproteobacteria bacterium]